MSESTNGIDTRKIPELGELKWRDYDVSPSRMPLSVVQELIRRAVGHVMSSEVSSSVGTEVKALIESGELDGTNEAAVKAKREEMEDAARVEFQQAFLDGTWGSARRGPRGPRATPVEAIFNSSVAKIVRKILNDNKGITYDKDTKIWTLTFADGVDESGNAKFRTEPRTLEQAMANWVAAPSNATQVATLRRIAAETAAATAGAATAEAATI